jgi:hypothetical protein
MHRQLAKNNPIAIICKSALHYATEKTANAEYLYMTTYREQEVKTRQLSAEKL